MKIKLTLTSLGLICLTALIVLAIAMVAIINSKVTNKLEGVLWTIPAKIYSRPLELAEGSRVNLNHLEKELKILSYEEVSGSLNSPGQYSLRGNILNIYTRGFENNESEIYKLKILNERIESIRRRDNIPIDLFELEPLAIGGVYPSHFEERLLLNSSQVPEDLKQIILAVEDRNFFNHFGISFRAILRALVRNTQAMGIQEGGSTITQQLAKSLFFSSEQTIRRKIKEAIAAVLIELHYSKDEILLAYVNDVFIAQSGRRAIHGFGSASLFFFGTTLENLSIDQKALLVGMLKGPSIYNPSRNPNRSLARRNLVLEQIRDQNLISKKEYLNLISKPIRVIQPSYRSISKYPSFSDLVVLDLRKNFKERDLRTEGLKVITNLDPVIQDLLESNLKETKKELVKKYGKRLNDLQGAALVIDSFTGEIKGTVGNIEAKISGFNRSINALRPIGSLIKPFIYLTALEEKEKYHLSTILDDSALSVDLDNGEVWEPNNFDKKFHGEVPLYLALSESYNIATTRLGMEIGYSKLNKTFDKLGIKRNIKEYPSLFVGAFELTPFEAIQAYQTIASNGFSSPLSSIRSVENENKDLSFSYPLQIEQKFRNEPIFLLKFALQQTFIDGTARGYSKNIINKWNVGGKTGTSDDQRDSWFVGYAGEYLALIWLGFDDNRKSPLTGRTGALQVWKKLMNDLDPLSLSLKQPSKVKFEWIDSADGLLSGRGCKASIQIPYIIGTEPDYLPLNRRKCRGQDISYKSKVVSKIKEVIEGKNERN